MTSAEYEKAGEKAVVRRNGIITLTLTLLMLLGLFTGYKISESSARADGYNAIIARVDGLRGFVMLYYGELKYMLLAFVSGFTVLSPAVCAAIIIYRGLALGYSAFTLYALAAGGALPRAAVAVIIASGCLVLLLLLAACVNSLSHRYSMKYALPDLRSLLSYAETRRYMGGFLAGATALLLFLVIQYVLLLILL